MPKKNIIYQNIVNKINTPVFVYDSAVLNQNIDRIKRSIKISGLEGRVSLKAAYFCNSNPHLFKILTNIGIGITIQSEEEHEQVKDLTENLILSPSFLSDREIDYWVSKNIPVNLASLEEVEYFIKHNPGLPINFRVDLTPEGKQRTAIKRWQLDKLATLLATNKTNIESFHFYAGTGSSLSKMKRNIDQAFRIYAKYFPAAGSINLGGGFGFDYRNVPSHKKHFNWQEYFRYLALKCQQFHATNLKFIIEPGRDIFADSGELFLKVKRIVDFGTGVKTISTDGSYVYMPSATIRARKHVLNFYDHNFDELAPAKTLATLSGCTTLSSDYVFPGTVKIPNRLKSGDYIVVNDTGAYCATQHMEFLNKRPCPEILIKSNDQAYLITKAGKFDDKLRNLLITPEKL